MQGDHGQVDQLDPYKGQDHTAQTPDQEVPAQKGVGAESPVGHSLEGDRNQCGDDQCVEDDGRQDGARSASAGA